MTNDILRYGILFAAAVIASGCNDSEYNPDLMEPHAFIVESTSSPGIAGKTVTIMLDEESTVLQLTAGVTEKVGEELRYKLVVDEKMLADYGAEQGTEYELLPESQYDLGGEIVIPADSYSSEPVNVTLFKLPEELQGLPVALPLRLEKVSGSVDVTSKTSGYVCVVASEVKDGIAYFEGATGLKTAAFDEDKQFNEFTIEIRFQIGDYGQEGATVGRNRDVFSNGHKILCRFEDPQTTNADDPRHSQVQFQADGFQNPAVGNHFEINQWQHFAVTYDGTDVTLYYNGQDAGVGAGQKSFTPSALGDCIFKSFSFMGGSSGDGGHGTGSEWWGDCKILCTEARVWSVCRTPDQIVNNIKSVSPTAQGLEGYWKMSRKTSKTENGVTIFEDLTGKGNDLSTTVNITQWPEVSTEDAKTEWPE